MTTSLRPAWETRLLNRARAGQALVTPHPPQLARPAELRRAYAECERVTRAHSRSFFLATRLLPPRQRRAMQALYALCRISDDLVDTQPNPAAYAAWRRQVLQPSPAPTHPVLVAWADTGCHYAIPHHYVEQMLDGIGQDLCPQPLQTFDDLAAYAYGVASTVGLMSMCIVGYTSADAVPYAIKLGVALQVTNILRDVGEDGRAGRLYLPESELEAFGVSRANLAAGTVDDRWRDFMRFQVTRNQQLYAEAWPGLRLLHPAGRPAVAAAAEFYRAILEDIEAHDYDVFRRRAHLGAWGKLRRLPGVWWRSRG